MSGHAPENPHDSSGHGSAPSPDAFIITISETGGNAGYASEPGMGNDDAEDDAHGPAPESRRRRGKPWWFWPVAALTVVLAIVLIVLFLAVAIPLLLIVLVWWLLRAWMRGFLPMSTGSGTPSAADNGMRRNVRVIRPENP